MTIAMPRPRPYPVGNCAKEIFIAYPRPPTPAYPRIAEPRRLMSKRCSVVAIHDGRTWGKTPAQNSCARDPPAARIASRGPSSICSTASANSFEIMPIEWMPSARMPGSGLPSAKVSENARAMTTSGTARVTAPIARPSQRIQLTGVVLAAATQATGTEMTAATTVPRMTMPRVSPIR